MLWIGLDDTDVLGSRGTGHLARQVATLLASDYEVLGVTRHQLLLDPRIPCTKKNSSAAVLLDAPATERERVLGIVKAAMADAFVLGSDPGLCVAVDVPDAITAFGHRTQQEVVSRTDAHTLIEAHGAEAGITLMGLGGDNRGVIGALAAVGLAATGHDGRYVLVGRIRELSGLQPIQAVLDAGVAEVRTLEGQPVIEGRIDTDRLRPARRDHRPVAVVTWDGDYWQPLKLD
ncbi:MAG: ABC transporter substrate-binding protein [Anaerolineae bacterium]